METIDLAPIEINPTTFLYKHCALPALPKVLIEFQEGGRSAARWLPIWLRSTAAAH